MPVLKDQLLEDLTTPTQLLDDLTTPVLKDPMPILSRTYLKIAEGCRSAISVE